MPRCVQRELLATGGATRLLFCVKAPAISRLVQPVSHRYLLQVDQSGTICHRLVILLTVSGLVSVARATLRGSKICVCCLLIKVGLVSFGCPHLALRDCDRQRVLLLVCRLWGRDSFLCRDVAITAIATVARDSRR